MYGDFPTKNTNKCMVLANPTHIAVTRGLGEVRGFYFMKALCLVWMDIWMSGWCLSTPQKHCTLTPTVIQNTQLSSKTQIYKRFTHKCTRTPACNLQADAEAAFEAKKQEAEDKTREEAEAKAADQQASEGGLL
jgi:hypothetical protein